MAANPPKPQGERHHQQGQRHPHHPQSQQQSQPQQQQQQQQQTSQHQQQPQQLQKKTSQSASPSPAEQLHRLLSGEGDREVLAKEPGPSSHQPQQFPSFTSSASSVFGLPAQSSSPSMRPPFVDSGNGRGGRGEEEEEEEEEEGKG